MIPEAAEHDNRVEMQADLHKLL